jgi:hypothetical protein
LGKSDAMRLHTPSIGMFVLSVVIAVLAVAGNLTPIPYITAYAFWIAILAYIVLALASLVAESEAYTIRRPAPPAATVGPSGRDRQG